jgi:hypothetical protein
MLIWARRVCNDQQRKVRASNLHRLAKETLNVSRSKGKLLESWVAKS